MRYGITGAVAAAGIALLAAACSSSTSSSSAASSPPASSAPAASSPAAAGPPGGSASVSQLGTTTAVSLAAISGIPGKVLVGSSGRTLYLFEADKNGTSASTGACAAAWPPAIVTGTPSAGSGVSRSLLGTIKRPDGTTQLTYNHHPLYYYVGDSEAHEDHGQGSTAFGGGWYVVNASGSKIDTD